MTVRELIQRLFALPETALDLTVITEGCDCTGSAGSVSHVDMRKGFIYLPDSENFQSPTHIIILREKDDYSDD